MNRSATKVSELRVKIFADGADKAGMLEMASKSFIKGLTTNPTLMRKAGISDYKAFARDVLKGIPSPSRSRSFPTTSATCNVRRRKSPVGARMCT
jgi:transaldolase